MSGQLVEPAAVAKIQAATAGSASVQVDVSRGSLLADDLSRDVYCILGLPVDCLEMRQAARRVEAAAHTSTPFLVSTPNLNFLIRSLEDPEFRDSVDLSALSLADGAPVVWIGRLLGMPLKERVAGSDLFTALAQGSPARPLKVFFFGGPEGAAEVAGKALNRRRGGLSSVGAMYPGHGSIDDLSTGSIIDAINASGAQFLVVALGAVKGQAWLLRNHDRIETPVRAHLGAVINFEAGRVRRAPRLIQQLGLEWLWRIKEEPYLWRRYWNDGIVLLRLLFTRILPLLAHSIRHRLSAGYEESFAATVTKGRAGITVNLSGPATAKNIIRATSCFRELLTLNPIDGRVAIDVTNVSHIDARFLGLLLMVRKMLRAQGRSLQIVGTSRHIERLFQLNEAAYLLVSR